MKHAAEDAVFGQQPGHIPNGLVERHDKTGTVEEVYGLCRHARGKQGNQPARHREDVAVRNSQQAEIGQRGERCAGDNSQNAADQRCRYRRTGGQYPVQEKHDLGTFA